MSAMRQIAACHQIDGLSLSLSFLFTFSKVLAFFRKHFATPLPVEESQPERTVTTTFVALVCSSWQRRIALC